VGTPLQIQTPTVAHVESGGVGTSQDVAKGLIRLFSCGGGPSDRTAGLFAFPQLDRFTVLYWLDESVLLVTIAQKDVSGTIQVCAFTMRESNSTSPAVTATEVLCCLENLDAPPRVRETTVQILATRGTDADSSALAHRIRGGAGNSLIFSGGDMVKELSEWAKLKRAAVDAHDSIKIFVLASEPNTSRRISDDIKLGPYVVLFVFLAMVADGTVHSFLTSDELLIRIALIMPDCGRDGRFCFGKEIDDEFGCANTIIPLANANRVIPALTWIAWSWFIFYKHHTQAEARAGGYLPWDKLPLSVLSLGRPFTSNTPSPGEPQQKQTESTRTAMAVKNAMLVTLVFRPPRKNRVAEEAPPTIDISGVPEPKGSTMGAADDSTQGRNITRQSVMDALSVNARCGARGATAAEDHTFYVSQAAAAFYKLLILLHSAMHGHHRDCSQREVFEVFAKIQAKATRSKGFNRIFDQIVGKLGVVLVPSGEEVKTLTSLTSAVGVGGDELLQAVLLEARDILIAILDVTNYMQTTLRNYQDARTCAAPSSDATEICSVSDCIWQCARFGHAIGQPSVELIIATKAYIDTANGFRAGLLKYASLGRALWRWPELGTAMVLLEKAQANEKHALRFLALKDYLNMADLFHTMSNIPSFHPDGIPKTAERAYAATLCWRIQAVAFAIPGERSYAKPADGDGLKVYIMSTLNSGSEPICAQSDLCALTETEALSPILLKSLRAMGIDAPETKNNNTHGLAARERAHVLLTESQARSKNALLQRLPMTDTDLRNKIGKAPVGRLNNVDFGSLQLEVLRADRLSGSEIVLPGTADLMVFFVQSPFNNGHTFRRRLALIADATLSPMFFSNSFQKKFFRPGGVPVNDLPPWVYPCLLQTLLVEGNVGDASDVQVSDDYLPLTRLSTARALKRSAAGKPWKVDNAGDLLTSKDKIVGSEEEDEGVE
jgi:endonuclease YncB( thermonuclease family)